MKINSDETATDKKSMKVATFKQKGIPRVSGRFMTALKEKQTLIITLVATNLQWFYSCPGIFTWQTLLCTL